jgi:hypothetical protein
MAQTATPSAESAKTIAREKLKKKIDLDEPFVLLETLSPQHFQHVHLPGLATCLLSFSRRLAPGSSLARRRRW